MENLFGINIGGDGINKKFRKETFFVGEMLGDKRTHKIKGW